MENQTKKEVVFSAIQPSGTITLGNYLGAVRNWVTMQNEYDCIYALADLHTITVRQTPAVMRKNIIDAYASIMACGIDVEKSLFFIQSHVHTHAELAWALSCYTQFGELSRMTQFKDKSAKHADNINAGLFTYPVLMAADILLYQADKVPVGADQKQHIEITRNIAERFNGIYGNVFKIPDGFIPKNGARVMSLQDPTRKMSKSDENVNGCVHLLDAPEVIMKKFKRAVTDSEAKVRYAEGKDGVNNLMAIYSAVTGLSYEQIEKDFDGKGYGDFKTAVGEAVVEELRPIRERYEKLVADKAYLESCYRKADEIALKISSRTMGKVMKKIGFLDELPIEVPERGKPLVPRRWDEGTIATVAFGYGLAVTPLHVITGFSAMINGGIYHTPTLLKQDHKNPGKRVISYQTSKSMRELLRLVVVEGSGKRANVKGYEVAGKTGTANKLSEKGKYVDKKVRTTFVAAFPISNPKYALLVMMDEPKATPESWGFVTSGWNTVPTAGKIIEAIAPQLNIKANYDLDELRNSRIIEASYSG